MINLFKNFGKGIIYVLVLPILLVGLAIYGVAAFFVFIYLAIKGLVLFFTGRSLYEDLPEDIEAKKRIALANGQKPQDTIFEDDKTLEKEAATIKEDDPINDDPFYVPQYLKEEEQTIVQEDKTETSIDEEKTPIITPNEDAKEEEIIIQKSSQNSAILDINDENDDDSDNSGVTIDYD